MFKKLSPETQKLIKREREGDKKKKKCWGKNVGIFLKNEKIKFHSLFFLGFFCTDTIQKKILTLNLKII